MRIAVIGASGMLGRHTVEGVIAAGHDVVAVGRSAKSLEAPAETAVKTRLGDMGDVTSLTRALQGVDAVINCAAYYPTVNACGSFAASLLSPRVTPCRKTTPPGAEYIRSAASAFPRLGL
jgi:uncharacterized protein YbjT (DUF2867 family)